MDTAAAEQFHVQEVFDDEKDARYASRALAIDLIDTLKTRGYTSFAPAPKPSSPDVIWDEFAQCRILIQWIPDWSHSPDAGKFGLRVDTLATK